VARARALERGYAQQGALVEADANFQRAVQAVREGRRAKRVQLSAQRKRVGYDRPILVKRREKVGEQIKGLTELQGAASRQAAKLAPPKITPPKKEKKKVGGAIGTVIGAAKLGASVTDKLLSGELTAKPVSAVSGVAGKFASGEYAEKVADPIAAAILGHKPKATPKGVKTLQKIGRGMGHDAVDLPANFIPSLYRPGKEIVKGIADPSSKGLKHIEAGGKMLGDPIYQTFRHPLKSTVEHPIGSAAIFAGVEGAVGRAGGAALRKGVAGKAGRRAARTERATRAIPHTRHETDRPYSPDVIRKGLQVAGERLGARRRVKRGEPAETRPRRHVTQFGKHDIDMAVDQSVRVSRNVHTLADESAATNVAHASNPPREIKTTTTKRGHQRKVKVRGRIKNKPLSAAHTVAVQGLTNATKADVQALLGELEQKASKLGGRKLRQNQRAQRELRRALKDWGPETEAHIRQLQANYRPLDAADEAALIDTGALDPRNAEAQRYAPAAVRHGLHDPETAAGHVTQAGEARAKAGSARRGAFRRRQQANTALREQVLATRVAELGPRGKRSAGTDRAQRDLKTAETTLQKAKEKEATDLAAARRELDDARHAAELSTTRVSPTPEVLAARSRLDTAQRNLADAVGAAARRERPSGRAEGRAQEKVAAADRAAKKAGRPAPAGTEPKATLAALERRGAVDLEHRQNVLRARAEVDNATNALARAEARAKGVPPKEADRLRRAIAGHDDARLRFADPDSLAHLRDQVDIAKAKLAYEQSKRGLSPDAADRLWKAIHEAEDAATAHRQAIDTHETYTAAHNALKDAPYIDKQGVPHGVDDVRNHPAVSGQPEPSFMPHAYEQVTGAVPVNRVKTANPTKSTRGLMVHEGTSPVGRGHLATARVARARLIEAARARIAIINEWGYREAGRDADVTVYSTKGKADAAAAEAERNTGVEMAAFADQVTGGYVLVPKRVVDRLGEHERNAARQDDILRRVGRAWRTGVLSTSTKWLTGQWFEPAVRLAVAHNFNPAKLARSYRILSRTLDELRAEARAGDPDAAASLARFESLYKRGGISRGVKVSRDEAFQDFMMRDAAGGFEAALRHFAQKPGAKQLVGLYAMHQRLWFHWLNGSVESAVRRGLVGRELIKDPIIRDRKFAWSFGQAAKDLAEGLKNTPAQNRVAAGLDDAFGKYQGRSPKEQAVIENATPFIPWFLSALRFLYVALPRDHPVLTALGAAASQSSEQWRRKYGIYFDPSTGSGMGVAGTEKNLPLSQQGSIPVGKDDQDILNVSHYTPFAAPAGYGDVGSFLFPQVADIQAAAKGQDWRGYGLTGRDQPVTLDRIAAATLTAALTTLAPPAGVGAKLLGIHLPSEVDVPQGEPEPDTGARAGKQFNPLPIRPGLKKREAQKKAKRKAASRKAAAKRRKPKPLGIGGGGTGTGKLPIGGGGAGGGKLPIG